MFEFKTFEYARPDIDFMALIPILVIAALVACAFLFELKEDSPEEANVRDLSRYRPTIIGFSALSLLGLLAYLLTQPPMLERVTFNGMIFDDLLTRSAAFFIGLSALFAILSGPDELERNENEHSGEYVALILSAALGMLLMVASANTIMIFLALELFSIALYLLCIFFPEKPRCQESGLKYFLLSSGASAVMLYGMALLYGATGTTWLAEMSAAPGVNSGLATTGAVMLLSGLLFKLAVVPFHSWAPDVYEGAPTTVTAFMSVATKVAALLTLWRIFVVFTPALNEIAFLIMFSLAVLSMLLGNLMALGQSSVKRMLAYSGVANAGYLLIAPSAGYEMQFPMLFFLAAYLLGNTGAFLGLALIEAHLGKEVTRSDLRGLFFEKPWLAAGFGWCLISLTGLPPAAGFMAKFYLFGSALSQGHAILPVFGILGSLIGMGYYMGATITLFNLNPDREPAEGNQVLAPVEETHQATAFCLGLCALGILLLGIQPNLLLNWFITGF